MTNWPTQKLGECLMQFDRGISWSRKDEGGTVAVLRIPNIEEGHINLDDLKYIDPKSGNGELDKNDIVMVASNGNPDLVGRSALVTEKEEGMRFASFLVRLRIDNTKLLSHYAHLFLLTLTFKRELRKKIATTSGIYNLRKEHVEKIKIPVPPLATQKQIVERLDKIAEAQKLNDGLIQKTDELFQSLLHKELNPVRDSKHSNGVNPADKDWKEDKFVNCIEKNPFKIKGIPREKYQTGGKFPIIDQSDKFIVGYTDDENKVYKIGFPIIIFGDHTRILKYIDFDFAIGADGTQIIIPDKKIFIPKFFYFLMLNLKISNLGYSRHFKILKTKKLIIPPLKTQKQIVAKLSAVQDYKKQLLEQKSKLKELFNSVLSKSMTNR